jgi:hypothetical protein
MQEPQELLPNDRTYTSCNRFLDSVYDNSRPNLATTAIIENDEEELWMAASTMTRPQLAMRGYLAFRSLGSNGHRIQALAIYP